MPKAADASDAGAPDGGTVEHTRAEAPIRPALKQRVRPALSAVSGTYYLQSGKSVLRQNARLHERDFLTGWRVGGKSQGSAAADSEGVHNSTGNVNEVALRSREALVADLEVQLTLNHDEVLLGSVMYVRPRPTPGRRRDLHQAVTATALLAGHQKSELVLTKGVPRRGGGSNVQRVVRGAVRLGHAGRLATSP